MAITVRIKSGDQSLQATSFGDSDERIVFGRDPTACDVVFPPVDVDRFHPRRSPEDFFLVVSRLNSYKRIDLAVEACSERGLPLYVVGDGPERARLEAIAGPSVRFLGRLPDADVADLFARCHALILPGAEDFGLTPLEANAAGRPVVAYAGGGALDTVRDGETGVLFHEPSSRSLGNAMATVAERTWDVALLRAHAETFAEASFAERFRAVIEATMARHRFGNSTMA